MERVIRIIAALLICSFLSCGINQYNNTLLPIKSTKTSHFMKKIKKEISISPLDGIELYCGDKICSPIIGETVITCNIDCKEKRK